MTNHGKERLYQGVRSGLFTAFRSQPSANTRTCAIDCKNDPGCLSFQLEQNVCQLGGRVMSGGAISSSLFIVIDIN